MYSVESGDVVMTWQADWVHFETFAAGKAKPYQTHFGATLLIVHFYNDRSSASTATH